MRDIQVHLRHLHRRIIHLEEEGLALVLSTPHLSVPFQRLLPIPRIAEASGLWLLAELAVLPSDIKAPQWGAHAGLDPRSRELGSALKAPRRITKAGNFMPGIHRANGQLKSWPIRSGGTQYSVASKSPGFGGLGRLLKSHTSCYIYRDICQQRMLVSCFFM
jgi:hypothetical protein